MKLLSNILLSLCVLLAAPAFAGKLDKDEENDLLYITEEEKLAHDVYLFFQRKYSERVFPNIRRSEQQHMEAMANLLARYGLTNPSKPAAGKFEDGELQELYNDLIKRGSDSRIASIEVGANIEEIDMRDLVEAIERTDEYAIKRVYGNLLEGSKSHLRAFVGRLQRLGVEYQPILLNRDEFEAIVGTSTGDTTGGRMNR
jgi:hypothetical protein